jgi:hypothetical protein
MAYLAKYENFEELYICHLQAAGLEFDFVT